MAFSLHYMTFITQPLPASGDIYKKRLQTRSLQPSVVCANIISGYAPCTREYGYQHESYHLC